MKKSKYVIIEHPEHGMEMPVLLPDGIEHKAAEKIGKPVAAGFCDLNPKGVHVWGASLSLGLQSRGDYDAQLIASFFLRSEAAAAS